MDLYIDNFIKNYNNITKELNDCIISLHKMGGGRIIFSKNKTYRSGMIILLDNIELYFEDNAILMASDNISDFNYLDDSKPKLLDVPTYIDCAYNGKPSKFFIYAYKVSNIKITGNGIIDGNEEIFYGKQNDHHIDGAFYPRVPLIYFEDCHNFSLLNINIRRSGFWTVHLIGCSNGLIDGISIRNNRKFACTDGIDPDHSNNLTIRNCYIESADDCVVFKTTKDNKKYGDTKNILVENCVFKSTSAAIKFGSESCSDMHDIKVRNIDISDTNRGISFQLRDEGNIYDIKFEDIKMQTNRFHPLEWWGKGEPIFVSAIRRYDDTKLGTIKDISFKNIDIISENGICIYGENNISNINFSNINIELKGFTNFDRNNHDLRPCYKKDYLIERKTDSIYLEGVSNIKINNYNLKINDNFKDDFGQDIYQLNVKDLSID